MFRRDAQWHVEHGPDHDLREFRGGRPTGRVARTSWPGEAEPVRGHGVWLLGEADLVTVVEQVEPGCRATRLELARRSVVDAEVVAEPGIPRVRVDLTVQLGPGRLSVQLWFHAATRPALERVLGGLPRPADDAEAAAPEPEPVRLPVLEVRLAPVREDWLVFRPGVCSAEVLRPAASAEPSPTSGALG